MVTLPHIYVDMPTDMLSDSEKREVIRLLKSTAAHELESLKYDGKPCNLTPGSIDVLIREYSEMDASLGAVVLIEVQAAPYPERMLNIKDRMKTIRDAILPYIPIVEGKHRSSSTFLTVSRDCWDSTL